MLAVLLLLLEFYIHIEPVLTLYNKYRIISKHAFRGHVIQRVKMKSVVSIGRLKREKKASDDQER